MNGTKSGALWECNGVLYSSRQEAEQVAEVWYIMRGIFLNVGRVEVAA